LQRHQAQVSKNFKSLPLIENRIKTIEVDSPRFLGKTEELFHDLRRSWGTLKSTEEATTKQLGELEQLVNIDNKSRWQRFVHCISFPNYHENYESFKGESFNKSFSIFELEESATLKKLDRLDTALRELPAFLIQASVDLEKISELISFNSNQSQTDADRAVRTEANA